MALDAQRFLAIKPGMIIVVGALAGMATRAGHDLTGPGVKNIFADGMGKLTMRRMTFATYSIDLCFQHIGMI